MGHPRAALLRAIVVVGALGSGFMAAMFVDLYAQTTNPLFGTGQTIKTSLVIGGLILSAITVPLTAIACWPGTEGQKRERWGTRGSLVILMYATLAVFLFDFGIFLLASVSTTTFGTVFGFGSLVAALWLLGLLAWRARHGVAAVPSRF